MDFHTYVYDCICTYVHIFEDIYIYIVFWRLLGQTRTIAQSNPNYRTNKTQSISRSGSGYPPFFHKYWDQWINSHAINISSNTTRPRQHDVINVVCNLYHGYTPKYTSQNQGKDARTIPFLRYAGLKRHVSPSTNPERISGPDGDRTAGRDMVDMVDMVVASG